MLPSVACKLLPLGLQTEAEDAIGVVGGEMLHKVGRGLLESAQRYQSTLLRSLRDSSDVVRGQTRATMLHSSLSGTSGPSHRQLVGSRMRLGPERLRCVAASLRSMDMGTVPVRFAPSGDELRCGACCLPDVADDGARPLHVPGERDCQL